MKKPKQIPWRRLSSKIAYKNPWVKIREDRVIKPDSSRGIYGYVDVKPTIMVVPMTAKHEIYLIEVYRYTTKHWSIEVPGGSADQNESLKQAAKRELQEETGLLAKRWNLIGVAEPLNGYSNELEYIYLARDLTQTSQHHQIEEGIRRVFMQPLDKVLAMIRNGKIQDGQAIVAICKTALWLGLLKLPKEHGS